jgi:hypothetical protein
MEVVPARTWRGADRGSGATPACCRGRTRASATAEEKERTRRRSEGERGGSGAATWWRRRGHGGRGDEDGCVGRNAVVEVEGEPRAHIVVGEDGCCRCIVTIKIYNINYVPNVLLP